MALKDLKSRDFLPEFAKYLKSCATRLGLDRNEVGRRIYKFAGISWGELQITAFWSRKRRGGKPDSTDFPNISWAHGTPPYFAGRSIERKHEAKRKELFKSVLPIDLDSFKPSAIQHLLPGRDYEPSVSHPILFPSWPLCVISAMEFKPNQHTGIQLHDAPGHVEVVVGVSGTVRLDFQLDDGTNESHYVAPQKHLIFDAGVPHRAYLESGQESGSFLVITFQIPNTMKGNRLQRLKREWDDASPTVQKEFLAWAKKHQNPSP